MNPEQLAKLREPFAREHMGKLPKPTKKTNEKGECKVCGGWHGLPAVHLDFVGHAAVTARLLNVDPAWTWEPFGVDPNTGEPVLSNNGTGLWIRLTVGGVTRPGYGDVEPEKAGNVKELISDALRNAAMRFGVALELWSKSELEAATQGVKCRTCDAWYASIDEIKPHYVTEHGWTWGDGEDAGKIFPPGPPGAADPLPDPTAADGAAPPPPSDPPPPPVPAPQAPPAPSAAPVAVPPPDESEGPAEDEAQPDDDEVTYAEFKEWTTDAVKAYAGEHGITKSRSVATLRDKVWAHLVDEGIGVVFECNYDGCEAFAFNTEEEATEHFDATHGGPAESEIVGVAAADEAAEEPAPEPEPPAADVPDDSGPCPEGTLQVIRDELARLSGGAARSYSEYRKKHGISKVEDLTYNQAVELVDFLDRLPH